MLAISVFIIPAANVLFFVPANLLNGDSKNFPLMLFAVGYSSLAAICGYWLGKANQERSFQEV
jgi:membrane protein YqaA with SNARE-associated domain